MNGPIHAATSPVFALPDLLARAGIGPRDTGAIPDVKITSLADDSRDVRPHGLFVAVRGTQSDGHSFLHAAVNAGAACLVVDRDVAVPDGIVRLRVRDSRAALALLAAAYHGLGDGGSCPKLIGITGTNGKTTVAWLLRSMLAAAGRHAAMLGTIEYDLLDHRLSAPLTTPGPLELCRHVARARDAGADYIVLEVSSHALAQHRTDGLRFDAAVFTNLSGDHLDFHGSMGDYRRAKRRLFESLDEHALAAVNLDDSAGESMVSDVPAKVVSYGIDAPVVDVAARIETMDMSGSRIAISSDSFDARFHSPLVGRHNVLNVLAAATVARKLGVDAEAIAKAVIGFAGVPGRLQRVEPRGCNFSVLVDYAHTDDALSNVLESLRELTTGRLLCVFGCGGDRDREKRPRMAAVVERFADRAFVTSDNPRTESPRAIIDDILPGFGSEYRCCVEVRVDRREAIEAALAEARQGDVVLIAGKGHEDYQLVGDRVLAFDDAKVARESLASMAIPEGVG